MFKILTTLFLSSSPIYLLGLYLVTSIFILLSIFAKFSMEFFKLKDLSHTSISFSFKCLLTIFLKPTRLLKFARCKSPYYDPFGKINLCVYHQSIDCVQCLFFHHLLSQHCPLYCYQNYCYQ